MSPKCLPMILDHHGAKVFYAWVCGMGLGQPARLNFHHGATGRIGIGVFRIFYAVGACDTTTEIKERDQLARLQALARFFGLFIIMSARTDHTAAMCRHSSAQLRQAAAHSRQCGLSCFWHSSAHSSHSSAQIRQKSSARLLPRLIN